MPSNSSRTVNDSGQSTSLWMRTAEIPARPSLGEDTDADVCVIGAGIAGLSTAYMLACKGVRVVVIDDGPIGGGATCRTTAHLSCALDDRFFLLEGLLGEKPARLAGESHAAAIDAIEQIVHRENIDCDFQRLDGYLFVPPGHAHHGYDLIEQEIKAAKRAGLPVAREGRAPIPSYNTGLCLRFKRQAQFHPLKYLAGLAHAVESAGGKIYERTAAAKVRGGSDAYVRTRDGHTITADAVVVATNSPVNDRVRIHTKQAPYRTYVVALQVPRGAIPYALYWDGYWSDEDESYHYVRLAPGPADSNGGGGGGGGGEGGDPMYDVLIVGGEDHKTGQADDFRQRYLKLEEWARLHFREAKGVLHRWSGQVMEPADGMGFIGRNPLDSENVYIATGDSGQGMTHGTIAGMLITDLIRGVKNPWADLYSPGRSVASAAGEYWSENLNVAKQYGDWFGKSEIDSVDKIRPGSGAVLRQGLRKLAVYKDDDGSTTELSATCTHMGCVVRWNAAEKTWDCPCHGSRYDPHGRVLNGPAITNLKVQRKSPAPTNQQTPGRDQPQPTPHRPEPQTRPTTPRPRIEHQHPESPTIDRRE